MLRPSKDRSCARARRRSPNTRWLASSLTVLGVCSSVALIAACSGGDGGTAPEPGPGSGGGTAGFTIASSSPTLSVARGATGTVTITVTRTGSFTGPVSLQPTGMPSGVTALFSLASVPAGQTTSTLTFTASATAAAATTTINVVANGAGVANQTLAVQLTVTAPAQAGPFAMSLSVSSFLALPPTTLTSPPVLTITRNAGFTGAVAITVSGLPAGLVVAASPNSVTGNTASVVILNGGAPNGTYPVTIRGVAAGLGEQSLTFQVVVAPPTTGSVQWQFCDNGVRTPVWFLAVKDGSGAWTRIVPNGNAYAFNVAQPTASVAMVTSENGGFRTTVYQYTAQELTARAAAECALYSGVTTRTATGAVTGATAADLTFASMGWWQGSVNGSGSYSLQNLPSGPLDLVAVRGAVDVQGGLVLSRGIVRRATNPASGGANAPIDFNAAESFAMVPATWTFGNVNGDQFGITQKFVTAGGTSGVLTITGANETATAQRTVYGIPAAQTIAGDLHQVVATVATNGAVRATRQIVAYARTLAARSLAFGPALPAPTVSVVAGAPAARLRAQGTLPNEYNSGISLDISQTSIARYGTLQATRGGLGAGSAYDVQMPDLTAVLGWDTNFAMRAGAAAQWWVSGGGPVLDVFDPRYIFNNTLARWTGALTGITAPSDGATYLMGRASGAITP